MDSETKKTGKRKKLIIINIRDQWYGISSEYINEVSKTLPITNVPWTPNYVWGVANLRGNIISIVDAGQILGQGEAEILPSSRIVVCQIEEILTGLLVDAMFEIVDVNECDIKPAITTLDKVQADYLLGEIEIMRRIVPVLNPLKIAAKLKADQSRK